MTGRLTTRARRLRRDQTDCEALLWRRLRARSLEGRKFYRQYVLGPYIVDFVCLEERLVVEIDGGPHDSGERREAARAAWLEAQGFRLIRFWNTDVTADCEGVLDAVRRALIGDGE